MIDSLFRLAVISLCWGCGTEEEPLISSTTHGQEEPSLKPQSTALPRTEAEPTPQNRPSIPESTPPPESSTKESEEASSGPASTDALTAALENDDRKPERQQHAAGMLRTPTGANVTLHSFFTADSPSTQKSDSTTAFLPGPMVLSVPSPTLIREIIDWTHHRHHGPPAAVEIALYDGTQGWVDAQMVLVGADVVDVDPNDTLNIRIQRDWKSDKIAEVGPKGRLFYSPIDRHEQVGMQGCRNEFIAVRTIDGVDGYASCVYFR